MAGRNSISVEAVNRRRDFVAHMKVSGYSVDCICEIVNSMSDDEGWGRIHRRMAFYDLYLYFREHPDERDDGYNYAHIQHRVLLETLDKDIKQLAEEIERRKAANDWKPFEFARTVMKHSKLIMKYMEIRGWNYSKRKKAKWDKR